MGCWEIFCRWLGGRGPITGLPLFLGLKPMFLLKISISKKGLLQVITYCSVRLPLRFVKPRFCRRHGVNSLCWCAKLSWQWGDGIGWAFLERSERKVSPHFMHYEFLIPAFLEFWPICLLIEFFVVMCFGELLCCSSCFWLFKNTWQYSHLNSWFVCFEAGFFRPSFEKGFTPGMVEGGGPAAWGIWPICCPSAAAWWPIGAPKLPAKNWVEVWATNRGQLRPKALR